VQLTDSPVSRWQSQYNRTRLSISHYCPLSSSP